MRSGAVDEEGYRSRDSRNPGSGRPTETFGEKTEDQARYRRAILRFSREWRGRKIVGRAPFCGLLIAVAILCLVEGSLHSDAFLMRYRAVFAAGRAMDKVLNVERAPPQLLVIGNSRADNGVVPAELTAQTGLSSFNLGIPGTDACNQYGIALRLARKDRLGAGRIERVLLVLDEGFLQATDGLGYSVFFDDRRRLLKQGRFIDWGKSWFRLWGFAPSLKTLQEPEKLIRFAQASIRDIAPWGGNARDNRGFRAAESGKFQDAAQLAAQEVGSTAAPAAPTIECLFDMIGLFQAHDVKVAVAFPPLLNRMTRYEQSATGVAAPYRAVRERLVSRGVVVVEVDNARLRNPAFFANAGHLNADGAQRYSAALGARLNAAW
ncbi:MAG: hypothetical protein HYX63_00795 [Gammaproteobacteria bacterium]|nr:hypothetical protein [Gammaproteobacteria bacterium]